jgi:hypothetical protein
MTQEEKATMYDSLIRESDYLQNLNSKYKSQYVGNIPHDIQTQIDQNNHKISILVNKLESLFR